MIKFKKPHSSYGMCYVTERKDSSSQKPRRKVQRVWTNMLAMGLERRRLKPKNCVKGGRGRIWGLIGEVRQKET